MNNHSLLSRLTALELRSRRAPILLEVNEGDDVIVALEDYRRRFNADPTVILSGIPTRQYEPDYPPVDKSASR